MTNHKSNSATSLKSFITFTVHFWQYCYVRASPNHARPQMCAERRSATLKVSVPEKASIYVNGNPTSSIGSQRVFVSKPLKSREAVRFEIRAVLDDDEGRSADETRIVTVRPGRSKTISFDFADVELARR